MTTCTHDLAEREGACADGYCPLCMAAELDALRECVRAADAMALECWRVGLISSTWLEDYDDARAKVTLP